MASNNNPAKSSPIPGSPMVLDNDNDNDEQQQQPSPALVPLYQVDQMVLARDGRTLQYYPAVVRQTRLLLEKKWSYRVHYSGWNARFDEWLSRDNILPDTPENQLLVQEQQAAAQAAEAAETETSLQPHPGEENKVPVDATTAEDGSSARKRSKVSSTTTEPASAPPASTQRRTTAPAKRLATTTTSSKSPLLYEDYCELPLTLKTILMDEWELVTRRGSTLVSTNWQSCAPYYYDAPSCSKQQRPSRRLHVLPAKVPVRKVLRHFEKEKLQALAAGEDNEGASASMEETTPPRPASASSPEAATPQQVKDFCNDLLRLFQDALPVCLLYPQERPQYEALAAEHATDDKPWTADVYGCEYLLRLYVRLPVLLQATANSKPHPPHLGPWLRELLVLVQKNRIPCFGKSQYRDVLDSEWMDWERQLYGSKKNENGKKEEEGSDPAAEASSKKEAVDHTASTTAAMMDTTK